MRKDLQQNTIESELIEKIVKNDADAFEKLFYTYCQPLINFTYRYVKTIPAAENIVQDVFLKIWLKRKQLKPSSNIKSYLYTAVKNEALKYLRHAKVVQRSAKEVQMLDSSIKKPEDELSEKELAAAVQKAIGELPQKSRMVFLMSKYDNLTYSEIAEIQKISKKTVETHMGRALKFLRKRLSNFFSVLLF